MKFRVALFVAGAACCVFGAAKTKPDMAEVDEEGNFFSTGGASQAKAAGKSDWGLKPLGGKGSLKVDATFKRKAEFHKRPVRKDGPVLVGDGVVCTVVYTSAADDGMVRLANEIARHLSVMSGRKVKVSGAEVSGPAVVLRREKGDDEQMRVCTEGGNVLISGSGAGLGHAVTYFLEALGCRFLWPGELGKVIPRKAKVVCPEMDFSHKPAMMVRAMRGGLIRPWKTHSRSRIYDSLVWAGIDAEEFRLAFNRAYVPEHASDRDFYRWHGILDNEESKVVDGGSKAKIKEGHYFKGYYEKFGKDHPEYFALQRNGNRDPKKTGGTGRPCFCYGNPEFARVTAAELIKDFDGHRKHKQATTVSPPDGGIARPCMCRMCRSLDPENAPLARFLFPDPSTGKMEAIYYPSLTDRMLVFFNRVMEGVKKAKPERGLTFYPYSYYLEPPVSVRPHPGLIAFSVAGAYVNTNTWNKGRENVAAWMNLGIDVYWRPNALNGWRSAGPQNFSRMLFEDIETMKANGLKGCEFDCVNNSWGAKGLDFYMVARAQLNPDKLSYEDQLDDYCTAGFGAAAEEIKGYFLAVERMNRAAAVAAAGDKREDLNFRRPNLSLHYLQAMEPDELDGILARAKSLVAGDRDILDRIRYLELAVGYARCGKRLATAYYGNDPEVRKYQTEYAEYMQKSFKEFPLAVNPGGICFYDQLMWKYRYRKGQPKKGKRK